MTCVQNHEVSWLQFLLLHQFKTLSLTMPFCPQVFDMAFPCTYSADFVCMSECYPLFLTHYFIVNVLFSLLKSTYCLYWMFWLLLNSSSPSISVLHAANRSMIDDKFPFSIIIEVVLFPTLLWVWNASIASCISSFLLFPTIPLISLKFHGLRQVIWLNSSFLQWNLRCICSQYSLIEITMLLHHRTKAKMLNILHSNKMSE